MRSRDADSDRRIDPASVCIESAMADRDTDPVGSGGVDGSPRRIRPEWIPAAKAIPRLFFSRPSKNQTSDLEGGPSRPPRGPFGLSGGSEPAKKRALPDPSDRSAKRLGFRGGPGEKRPDLVRSIAALLLAFAGEVEREGRGGSPFGGEREIRKDRPAGGGKRRPFFRGGGADLFQDRPGLRVRLRSQLLPESLPADFELLQGGQSVPALGQEKHLASVAGLVEGVDRQGPVEQAQGLRNVPAFLVEPEQTVHDPADPHQKLLPRPGDPVLELFAVWEGEPLHERSPDLPEDALHPGFAFGAVFRVVEKRAGGRRPEKVAGLRPERRVRTEGDGAPDGHEKGRKGKVALDFPERVESLTEAVVGPGEGNTRPEKVGKKDPFVGSPPFHGQKGEKGQMFLVKADGFSIPQKDGRAEKLKIEHRTHSFNGSVILSAPPLSPRLLVGNGVRSPGRNGRIALFSVHRIEITKK